nr:helicase domino-like isoform X3 [Crassostrea gigas]
MRRQQALQMALQQQQQQQQQTQQQAVSQQVPAVPQFNQQTFMQQSTPSPPASNPWLFPDNSLPLSPTNIIRALPPVSGSTNNEASLQTQPQTVQPGSIGSSPTEHLFDGHLTHQQALDRFAAPPVETGSAANGEPAIPGAEISHTLITIKDEQGNVIAEQLFPEGSSDATIEKYISEISANYTNQVRQGTAAAPGTGLGTSGNTASAPIGSGQEQSSAAIGTASGPSPSAGVR